VNAQERDQLLKFLASLRQTPVKTKDALADGIIRDALGHQPDAVYQLVQRCMALELALDAALSQIKAQASRPDVIEEKPTPSSWGTGLLAQAGTVALGSTLGIVAGGMLLEGIFPDDE
jgi:hypothetical protein